MTDSASAIEALRGVAASQCSRCDRGHYVYKWDADTSWQHNSMSAEGGFECDASDILDRVAELGDAGKTDLAILYRSNNGNHLLLYAKDGHQVDLLRDHETVWLRVHFPGGKTCINLKGDDSPIIVREAFDRLIKHLDI